MSADEIKKMEEEPETMADKTVDEAEQVINQNGEAAILQDEESDTVVEEPIEDRVNKLQQELAATKDSLLRKAAELENVRKRVQRERVALFDDAKVAALQDFLPISEDILRVLEAANEYKVDENFMTGVKLVASKFEEAFAKYGVEAINEVGVPFDVSLHDALLRQPAPDKKTKSDTVLQVLESGFKIGNKIIKHAKVIVSE
jgi:molecular chaperone GrpE